MNNPLVSVVVALYNSEKYIEDTIKSVLCQSYENIELIVVNDCSTDSSAEIVDKYVAQDSRVRMISLAENSGGPARPRNTGISEARGELIAFLDSDDVWEANKLTVQLERMNPADVMSFTSVNFINEYGASTNRPTRDWLRTFVLDRVSKSGLRGVLFYNPVPLSAALIRAVCLEDLKFDEDTNMHAIEDYGMWLNMFSRYPGRILFVKEKLVNYRNHPESISSCYPREHIKAVYCVTKFYLRNKKYEYLMWFMMGALMRTVKIVLGELKQFVIQTKAASS